MLLQEMENKYEPYIFLHREERFIIIYSKYFHNNKTENAIHQLASLNRTFSSELYSKGKKFHAPNESILEATRFSFASGKNAPFCGKETSYWRFIECCYRRVEQHRTLLLFLLQTTDVEVNLLLNTEKLAAPVAFITRLR